MGYKVMFGEVRTKEGDLNSEGLPTIVRYSDQDVDFDDLSPDVFAEIAKAVPDAGFTYWGVYTFPKQNPEIVYRVTAAAAEHAGIDIPAKPETMREHNALLERITETEDIGSQPMMGGNPPEPSETEPGSSSTSLGTTDGLEVSLEPNPSAGC